MFTIDTKHFLDRTHLVADFLSGALGVTSARLTGWVVPSSPHTVVALTTLNPLGAVALARVQTARRKCQFWWVFAHSIYNVPAGHVPICPLSPTAALLAARDCIVAIGVLLTRRARGVLGINL